MCLIILTIVFCYGVTAKLSLFIGLRVSGFGGLLIICWPISNFRSALLYYDCIFWVGLLCDSIFLLYFSKLIFWNLEYQANHESSFFPQYSSEQHTCMSTIPNHINRFERWSYIVTEFLDFLLGDNNISTFRHRILAFVVVKA